MSPTILPKEAKPGNSRFLFLSLWLPLILLQLTIAGFWWWSIRINNGHLVYASDDAYIHMAIAKNVVQHHVWGITPFGFTASSSSPLWTALLCAIYFCFGINVSAPLVINLLSASLLLLASWHFLRSHGMHDMWILLVQVGIIYLTPLPFLIFDGLEHSLQALLTILALSCASHFLERPEDSGGKHGRVAMAGFVFLLSALRYEGVFFALVVGLLLLIRKRVVDALATGAAAVAPVLLAGGWFTLHGWPFLPTPILLKSSLGSMAAAWWPLLPTTVPLKSSLGSMAAPYGWFRDFILFARGNLQEGQHLVAFILLSLSFYIASLYKGRAVWDRLNVASMVFILTALAHLACAGLVRGYRYEAYLVALGILVVAAQLTDLMRDLMARPLTKQAATAVRIAVAMLGGLLLLPLLIRGGAALYALKYASHHIYDQQYQMARFVRKYYQGSSVALNDIGAVNYYAQIHCLDLVGLGSLSVAKAMAASNLSSTTINQLGRGENTRIAIIYESWFYDLVTRMTLLPTRWVLVGTWTIPTDIGVGNRTVSFFAVDPFEGLRLTQFLKEFSSQLPSDVAQAGPYAEGPSKM